MLLQLGFTNSTVKRSSSQISRAHKNSEAEKGEYSGTLESTVP
jgi:hypothetical protein